MDSESKNMFTCKFCEKSFDTSRGLSAHMNDGLHRNELNEIVYMCNHCYTTFSSQRSLYLHRRLAKHAIDDVADAGEALDSAPGEEQDVYSSNGHIRNEISHETERVIELSTSMALGCVQDAVKQAFRIVHDRMIPLYMETTDIENMGDAWACARKITEPFENKLLKTLMRDTFKVAGALKRDLETL